MDSYTYTCNYCGGKYTPRRRFIQKYCSNSCRVNAFNLRKKVPQKVAKVKEPKDLIAKDKMSWSGVGNAAAGAFAINLATSLLTKEENKPATKGDIQKLLNSGLNKVILIKNVPPREDGSRAYFDTVHQVIIYK